MLVTIISQNGSEIKFSDCPPNDIVSTIPKSSTKLSPRDSALAAQRESLCDTIYVKGGEVILGHMKYYTSRKVVYTGCCKECTTEKLLKRKDVDSILYANGRRVGAIYENHSSSDPNNDNNNVSIENKPNTNEPAISPEEKEKAKKRMKLYQILGWSSLGLAITAVVFVSIVSITYSLVLGLIFFGFIIAALGFAMGFVRKRKQAGLEKEKKSKKK